MIHWDSETYKSVAHGVVEAWKYIELLVIVSRVGVKGKRSPSLPIKFRVTFNLPKKRKLEKQATFEQPHPIEALQARKRFAFKGINGN